MSDEQHADDQPTATADHRLAPREPESAGLHQDPGVVLAVYQTLAARRSSHADVLWRVPAFVLTAETFVYAGLLIITPRQAIIVLGLLGVLTALFGAITMRRAQLAAGIDDDLLDWFEDRMLGPERQKYRLHHAASFDRRANELAKLQGANRPKSHKLLRKIATPTWGAAAIWIWLLIAIGLGAVAIATGRLI